MKTIDLGRVRLAVWGAAVASAVASGCSSEHGASKEPGQSVTSEALEEEATVQAEGTLEGKRSHFTVSAR